MIDRVLYELEINAVTEVKNPKTGLIVFINSILLLSILLLLAIDKKNKHSLN